MGRFLKIFLIIAVILLILFFLDGLSEANKIVREYRTSQPSIESHIKDPYKLLNNPEVGTVNLWSSHTNDYVIGTLPHGTKVKVIGGPKYNNDVAMYRVYANGVSGWVSVRLLKAIQ